VTSQLCRNLATGPNAVIYKYPYIPGAPTCSDTLSFVSSYRIGTHYTYNFDDVTNSSGCVGTTACPAYVTVKFDSSDPSQMTYTWSPPTCGCPPGGCGPVVTGTLTQQ
jgi:hypothetical protein